MDETYLIWSIEHTAWWNPDELGYTVQRPRAGRYGHDAAAMICRSANAHLADGVPPNETMILSDDLITL